MSTNDEKALTKYELKMKKRAEEKAKEESGILVWKIVGIALIVAIVAFIASFPIKTAIKLNKVLFTVGGKQIRQVEYDYAYNNVKSTYMNNYGSYLSYYGLTEDADESKVWYSQDLTFKDYFDQLTIDQMKQDIALEKNMKADGYTYDATEDYKNFITLLEMAAKNSGVSASTYIKNNYGEYATKSRLKPFIKLSFELGEYYNTIVDGLAPSDADVQKYYEENKADYDSVDYYMITVAADLPTAPTELADEGVQVSEGDYTPSDAEVEAAMAEAKEKADAELETITTKGEAHVGELRQSVHYQIKSWLFDDSRKPGDTTVIEEPYEHEYYVVGFKSRYLSDEVNDTTGEKVWKERATATLTNQITQDYMDNLATDIQVEDPDGFLNYLKVEAEKAEDAQ